MPRDLLLPTLAGVAAGLVVALLVVALWIRRQRRAADGILATARSEGARLRSEAARDAEATKSEMVVGARMETLKLREELDREVQRRREEWERGERRAEERSRAHDRKVEEVEARERTLTKREEGLAQRELALRVRENEAGRMEQEQRIKLERIAGLTSEEARREILQHVEDEARGQAAALVRDIKDQAKRNADREARRIISIAIQRLAAEHTAETTVAAVPLPNDEMKGRIIGREGRNIRAFETATGVDVIIDDTPDTVIVSCFDPIRREVARRSLEALIQDGRIHPGRIEEIVAKVQKELETQLVELGEQAAYDTGIHGLHPELIKLIGRMRYRTSYGQNIYDHSKEVAWLAGMMAAELQLDVQLARRGGLLHDVGKVLTHEGEGTHVELGVDVARRYGESAAVINCIQAHHDDVPHESAESVLVQAADAISGARPGARREAFETYVKRLTRLEEIANGYPGRGEVQRDPGGPGGPRGGGAGADRRRRGGPAQRDYRPADRGRAAVSGTDQGRGHQGDESRGHCTMSGKTMSAKILDGAALAKAIRAEVAAAVAKAARSTRPGLAAVLVGDDPASAVYVRSKGKACEEAGMHSETIRLPTETTEAELLARGGPAQRRSEYPRHPGAASAAQADRQREGPPPGRSGQGRGRVPSGERGQAGHRRPERLPARDPLRRAADARPLGHRDQRGPRGDRGAQQHRRQADGQPADPAGPRRRRDGDGLPLAGPAIFRRSPEAPTSSSRRSGSPSSSLPTWCARARW